jgi:exosome complex protein LRP1
MSDVKSLQPDLDRLDAQIDGIEDALQPLLRTLEKPSQLPLLDKAKLFSLTAYTIETLLFCMPICHYSLPTALIPSYTNALSISVTKAAEC